ncbi:DUF4352 domain-containing protein [Nocardiopsis valliformis]|uniref:DUF4352 domain-containing protein n=1 Tax=Nocardiopsis valliformis TaxID=239974 RepID=UPI00034ABB33|nr:DUF4352 domain-containing protein [Nocardiopsis valliformis]
MNRTGWIATIATGVVALLLGFSVGWFGNQAYIRAQFTAAFDDIGAEFEDTSDTDDVDEAAVDESDELVEELPDAAPMGEAASDGIWDITLSGVERTDQVNGSYSNAVADDGWEFVVLEVELTNTSNGPQMPEVDNSEVMDADGNRYGYHTDALFALDEDDALYEDVNPNGSVTVRLPFEVEAGTVMESALLSAAWDAPSVAVLEVKE